MVRSGWLRNKTAACTLLGLTATGANPPPKYLAVKHAGRPVVVHQAAAKSVTPIAADSAYARLAPVQFLNINTRQQLTARLYTATGQIDEAVATQLDQLLCDSRKGHQRESTTIDRRTLQQVYRAAYHFRAYQVEVISAYRKSNSQREGIHALGRAIDFKLAGVDATQLAAYYRTIPRLGVGIYTHPKTHFVHLDVRERSFHWLDASPPRRHWRERNISAKSLGALDAQYSSSWDWPEGLAPPK